LVKNLPRGITPNYALDREIQTSLGLGPMICLILTTPGILGPFNKRSRDLAHYDGSVPPLRQKPSESLFPFGYPPLDGNVTRE